jgi:hypothetical protein
MENFTMFVYFFSGSIDSRKLLYLLSYQRPLKYNGSMVVQNLSRLTDPTIDLWDRASSRYLYKPSKFSRTQCHRYILYDVINWTAI